MRILQIAAAAVGLLITTFAGAQTPPSHPGTAAWCDLAGGALTGRASNESKVAVKCTVNCLYVLPGGATETFGCFNKTVAPGQKNKNICGKTAKAKAIVGDTQGFCKAG